MFKLEKQSVHAIVAKMIISEELMASMDEPSECMVMHRTEPSRLQALSLQLADKLAQLVENNERLLELRPGGNFSVKLICARKFKIWWNFSNTYDLLLTAEPEKVEPTVVHLDFWFFLFECLTFLS